MTPQDRRDDYDDVDSLRTRLALALAARDEAESYRRQMETQLDDALDRIESDSYALKLEVRIVAARDLICAWRTLADECERRKIEAADSHYPPGEDINRAKMLTLRDCADKLEKALPGRHP